MKTFHSLASTWKYGNTSTCCSSFVQVNSLQLQFLLQWAAFFCLAWAVFLEPLQSAVTAEESRVCCMWQQIISGLCEPNPVFVFWGDKLLVCLSNSIEYFLGFVYDMRRRVFKVVWATLYYLKFLKLKFWFALFNKLNLYFWVPLKPFECMSNQQCVHQ